jgi:hypothetical protein
MRATSIGLKDPREISQAPLFYPNLTYRGTSLVLSPVKRERSSSQTKRFYDPTINPSTNEFTGPTKYVSEIDTIAHSARTKTHALYKGEMVDSELGAYSYVGDQKVYNPAFLSAKYHNLKDIRGSKSMDMSAGLKLLKMSAESPHLRLAGAISTEDTPAKVSQDTMIYTHSVNSPFSPESPGLLKLMHSKKISSENKSSFKSSFLTEASAKKLKERVSHKSGAEINTIRSQFYSEMDNIRKQIDALEKKKSQKNKQKNAGESRGRKVEGQREQAK